MITSNISFGQKMTSLQNTKKCPTKSQQKITGILQKIKVKVSHLNILRVILICCVVKKENFITRDNLTLTPNTPPITTPPPLIFTLQLKVFSLFIHNRNAYFIFWTFLCIIVVKIKSLCVIGVTDVDVLIHENELHRAQHDTTATSWQGPPPAPVLLQLSLI